MRSECSVFAEYAFWVDDKVSFIILGVTKKMVVIYLYLTILVAELKSQLYVLAEGL